MRQTRILCLMTVGALFSALVGCGSTTSGASNVRTLNAYVPAAGGDPSVTVVANGTTVSGNSALGFGQVSNGGTYTPVTGGTFAPTATGAGVSGTLSFATPPTTTGGAAYMLLVAGQAGQAGTLTPQLILAPEYVASSLSIPTGSVAVRVINASTNPNPIGLYTTAGGTVAPVATSLGSVAFGYAATANAYVSVPTTQLTGLSLVDTTATTTPLSLAPASNLTSTPFASGLAYTLYVFGQPGNATTPLTALWVLDQ